MTLKNISLALTVFILCASAPQPANAAQTQAVAIQADNAQLIDQAFENLRSKVVAGTVTPSDYDRVNQAIAQDPSLAPYRARLEAIVEALRAAKTAAPAEVKRAHALTNDTRLEYAFQTLHAAIEKGRASEADFDRVALSLTARALIAQGMELDFRAHQKRLEAALQELKKKFLAKELLPTDVAGFNGALSQIRFDTSIADLEHRVEAKTATQADFAYVRQVVTAYVALAMKDQEGTALVRRVNGILDSIQKRLMEGGAMSAEQFAQLRTSLTTRAKEASADTTK